MDGVVIVAAFWGFAEATLFFIVPDVWLTMVAVVSPRRVVSALVATLAGAIVGGFAMRAWGRRNPMAARHAIGVVPGIHAAMVQRVDDDMRARGLRAMVFGPLGGVPYKIYAVAASRSREGLAPFALVSLIARVPRLVLLTVVALALRRWPLGALPSMGRGAVVGGIWIVFYCWYFRAMSVRPQ